MDVSFTLNLSANMCIKIRPHLLPEISKFADLKWRELYDYDGNLIADCLLI